MSNAQPVPDVSNYNPFFVISSGVTSNRYNSEHGVLELSQITVWPSSNGKLETLFNTVLKYKGDNLFELIAVDELLPQQECTRAEVSNAIPQLTLNLDIATAETLIGCNARIDYGPTDLELGKLVYASWAGVDGVPNSYSNSTGFIGGTGSVWIPQSGGYLSAVPLASSQSPSITFALRENVLESIFYAPEGPTSICLNVELTAGFQNITATDTVEEINAKLACAGNLQQVVMHTDFEQRSYSWQSQTQPPVFINTPTQPTYTANQSVSLNVVNEGVQNLRLSSNANYSMENVCSIEEIITASDSVQAGQSVGSLSGLLACGPRRESLYQDEQTESLTYQWYSQVPNESNFVSKNRSLRVTVVEGVVSSVQLYRH